MASASTAIEAARTFTGSIGVNVAMDFFDTPYANASAVAADLAYLGVGTVRDALPASDAVSLAPYAKLVAAGIRFDFIAAAGGGNVSLATVKSELDAFATKFPGAIAAIEGENEPNIWQYSYNGQTGVAGANAFQQALHNLVQSDPLLKGVQIIDYPWGGVGPDTYAQAGSQTGIADVGAIHVYPDGEGNSTPQPMIAVEQGLAAPYNTGHGIAMTEFGYSTNPGGDTTALSQARFEVEGLLDTTKEGITSTYLYELVDGDSSTTNTDIEAHYGLFNSDTTTPKGAATAIHNLTSILADTGTGALPAAAFNPTVTGLPAGAQTALFEKSNGTVDLAIWNEGASAQPVLINVAFGATAGSVAEYDVITGSAPVKTASGIASLQVALGADPLIIELKQAGGVTTPTPPAAPPPVPAPAPPPTPAPVTTPAPTPTPTPPVPTHGTQTIIASVATVTASGTRIKASGSHTVTITGSGDTLHATGGTETVQAIGGHETVLTGAGNDVIHFLGTGNVIDAGAGTNALYDSGSGNTIVLPVAAHGIDNIHGNVLSNGDTFDLRAMLQPTTWSGVSRSDLGDYIRITPAAHGADSVISVAPDGSFADGSYKVADLHGVSGLNLQGLLAHSITN